MCFANAAFVGVFIQETDGKDSGEDDSEFWEGLIRNRSYNSFHTKSV